MGTRGRDLFVLAAVVLAALFGCSLRSLCLAALSASSQQCCELLFYGEQSLTELEINAIREPAPLVPPCFCLVLLCLVLGTAASLLLAPDTSAPRVLTVPKLLELVVGLCCLFASVLQR